MSNKAIVLDANILIRAVLGKRVRELIAANAGTVQFFAPDVAYADARKYLPALLEKRGVNSEAALTVLDALESIVQPLELGVYSGLQAAALQRIAMRDADDWPVLACAMTIACPVWREDADFFGTGIATWTTDRVERCTTATRGSSATDLNGSDRNIQRFPNKPGFGCDLTPQPTQQKSHLALALGVKPQIADRKKASAAQRRRSLYATCAKN